MSDEARLAMLKDNRNNLQRHIVVSFNMAKQEGKGAKKVNLWNGGSTWVSAVSCKQDVWDEAVKFMEDIRCLFFYCASLSRVVFDVVASCERLLCFTVSVSHWANGCPSLWFGTACF